VPPPGDISRRSSRLSTKRSPARRLRGPRRRRSRYPSCPGRPRVPPRSSRSADEGGGVRLELDPPRLAGGEPLDGLGAERFRLAPVDDRPALLARGSEPLIDLLGRFEHQPQLDGPRRRLRVAAVREDVLAVEYRREPREVQLAVVEPRARGEHRRVPLDGRAVVELAVDAPGADGLGLRLGLGGRLCGVGEIAAAGGDEQEGDGDKGKILRDRRAVARRQPALDPAPEALSRGAVVGVVATVVAHRLPLVRGGRSIPPMRSVGFAPARPPITRYTAGNRFLCFDCGDAPGVPVDRPVGVARYRTTGSDLYNRPSWVCLPSVLRQPRVCRALGVWVSSYSERRRSGGETPIQPIGWVSIPHDEGLDPYIYNLRPFQDMMSK